MKSTYFIGICFCVLSLSVGDLSIGPKKCGVKFCEKWEYCSNVDNFCRPCTDICEQNSHNFDPTICTSNCQDYIHDIRYMRKHDSDDENLSEVVNKLHHMVTVTLTLVCLTLIIVLVLIAFQVWKWMKNNDITLASLRKKYFSKKSDGGNNTELPGNLTRTSGKTDLRLDMPPPNAQSEHSPATVSTSISRRPAEDSTLDYAYDNPAMSSPGPKAENTF